MAANSKTSKHVKVIVPRITQLDSVELDESIRQILSSQLSEVEGYLRPGTLSPLKPELELLVDVLVFRNSLLKHGGTFGQQMLNLTYEKGLSGKSTLIYVLLTITLPYFKRRYDESWRGGSRPVRSIVDGLWNIGKLAQLLNLLWFLREGLYPTVTDRLLGLQHSNIKTPSRGVGYNYMVRELLWHSFRDLLVFTLPLVNFRAMKRKLRAVISKPSSEVQVPIPAMDLATVCAVCTLRPVTPCRISLFCPHVACYLCLKGSIIADEKFVCPDCGALNTATRNFQYITS